MMIKSSATNLSRWRTVKEASHTVVWLVLKCVAIRLVLRPTNRSCKLLVHLLGYLCKLINHTVPQSWSDGMGISKIQISTNVPACSFSHQIALKQHKWNGYQRTAPRFTDHLTFHSWRPTTNHRLINHILPVFKRPQELWWRLVSEWRDDEFIH